MLDVDRLVQGTGEHADRGEVDDPAHVEGERCLEDIDRSADVDPQPVRSISGEVRRVNDHAQVDDLVRTMLTDDVEHARDVSDGAKLQPNPLEISAENELSNR